MTSRFPVTVVIPHLKSREKFFQEVCLPSVKINNPAEIIVLAGDESAQVKRNKGAKQASEEFLLMCDDDVRLESDFVETLLDEIGEHDFAYTDYYAVDHPTPGFLYHTAKEFNPVTLRQQNYVSTMSLIRKKSFPGFDESINRLQDWDLFLTIVDNGGSGIKCHGTTFTAYWLDQGITGNDEWANANSIVRRKHNI